MKTLIIWILVLLGLLTQSVAADNDVTSFTSIVYSIYFINKEDFKKSWNY